MLAIVAPGQGAQTPGFLKPWIAASSSSRSAGSFAAGLDWLSAVSGLDLVRYGTEADAETIRDTAVAQPLLVAAGLLAFEQLLNRTGTAPEAVRDLVGVAAGHSVGELTTAAAVGVLNAEQAMVLVRERGRAMAEAAAVTPTSMTAVIAGKPDEVLAKIAEHGLTPANNNGRGQIVAAGTVEQLQALAADPPARARLIELSVAGAFHTDHMAPAVQRLQKLADAVTPGNPRTRLLSDYDGRQVSDGTDALDRIVRQVSAPVRWDLCMDTLAELGVTGLLELPPAGTLTGIAKRNLKGVELFALNSPDELDDAAAFVAAHAGQVVGAPAPGRFVRADGVDVGTVLPQHGAVGAVTQRHDEFPVDASSSGTVVEWLVEDGATVAPEQSLLRLQPVSQADGAEATS